MIAEVCWGCVVGLHEECLDTTPVDGEEGYLTCCCGTRGQEPVVWGTEGTTRVLAPQDVTDVLSTGRKRADMMLVIYPGQVCSWAGLRHAGGGVGGGIIGCRGNRIADVKKHTDLPDTADMRGERHHGPDKNTLNNSVGVNLHGICSSCHSRWHAIMDRYYEGDRPAPEEPWLPTPPEGMSVYPHDPKTRATADEIELNEAWWNLRPEKREAYPFLLVDEPDLP